jgi:hypothetical protein
MIWGMVGYMVDDERVLIICQLRSHEVVCQPWLCVNPRSCDCVPSLNHDFLFNELILGWELVSIHIVNMMLKLMNTKCRLLSPWILAFHVITHNFTILVEYQP